MSLSRSDDRVWVVSSQGNYCLLGPGFTHLEERWKTALLETPNVNSAVCGREILHHTGELQFEGHWIFGDPAMDILRAKHPLRGSKAKVTLIVANRQEAMTGTGIMARRVTGYVCLENPGTGEGAVGSSFKGKIVYAGEPENGIFDEGTQQFHAIS